MSRAPVHELVGDGKHDARAAAEAQHQADLRQRRHGVRGDQVAAAQQRRPVRRDVRGDDAAVCRIQLRPLLVLLLTSKSRVSHRNAIDTKDEATPHGVIRSMILATVLRMCLPPGTADGALRRTSLLQSC